MSFRPEAPKGAFFMAKKVVFYIDGFNFYNGLRNAAEIVDKKPGSNRWKKFYWIDIVKFCSSLLRNDEQLVYVRYFTARPLSAGKRSRQNRLMKVNEVINNDLLKITYGEYFEKEVRCQAICKELFTVPEEKQTDVNIASAILEDYFTGICDKSILISADSDLLPPMKVISKMNKRLDREHDVEVCFPPGRYSSEIYNCRTIMVRLLKGYRSAFNKALLPEEVVIKERKIEIPTKWKEFRNNVPGG